MTWETLDSIFVFQITDKVWEILFEYDVQVVDGESVLTKSGIRDEVIVSGSETAVAAAREAIIEAGLGDEPELFSKKEMELRNQIALGAIKWM